MVGASIGAAFGGTVGGFLGVAVGITAGQCANVWSVARCVAIPEGSEPSKPLRVVGQLRRKEACPLISHNASTLVLLPSSCSQGSHHVPLWCSDTRPPLPHQLSMLKSGFVGRLTQVLREATRTPPCMGVVP
jgi:hypothetical protein